MAEDPALASRWWAAREELDPALGGPGNALAVLGSTEHAHGQSPTAASYPSDLAVEKGRSRPPRRSSASPRASGDVEPLGSLDGA